MVLNDKERQLEDQLLAIQCHWKFVPIDASRLWGVEVHVILQGRSESLNQAGSRRSTSWLEPNLQVL